MKSINRDQLIIMAHDDKLDDLFFSCPFFSGFITLSPPPKKMCSINLSNNEKKRNSLTFGPRWESETARERVKATRLVEKKSDTTIEYLTFVFYYRKDDFMTVMYVKGHHVSSLK